MHLFNMCNSCDGVRDSMDVRFTKACDNNCAFCIERNGVPSRPAADAIQLAEAWHKAGQLEDVLILGGEPMLYPDRLLDFVKLLRPHVGSLFVTTSLPLTMSGGGHEDTVFQLLQRLDGLNVSLQSVDSDENNRLLGASSKHNRLDILKRLCGMPGISHRIRVSLNMCRGGIDTFEKLKDALQRLESTGVRHVKVNELQHAPEHYVSFEDMLGYRIPGPLHSPYAHGCQTDETALFASLFHTSLRVTLKRSCFVVEKSRRASLADLAKAAYKRWLHRPSGVFKVMYENGQVETAWLKDDKKGTC